MNEAREGLAGQGRDDDFRTAARADGPDAAWTGLAIALTPGPTSDEEAEATRAAGPDGPRRGQARAGRRQEGLYTPDPPQKNME